MDPNDSAQDGTAPQTSRDRPLPTRFGRDSRAAELAGRGRASRTEDAAAVEVTDDEALFEDRDGL